VEEHLGACSVFFAHLISIVENQKKALKNCMRTHLFDEGPQRFLFHGKVIFFKTLNELLGEYL